MARYPQHLGPYDRTAASVEEAERILRALIEEIIVEASQRSSRSVSTTMRQELLRHTDHGHFADRNRDGLVERCVEIHRQETDNHGGHHTIARAKVIWDADRTNDIPVDQPRAQTDHYGYEVHTSAAGGSLRLHCRGHIFFPEGFHLPHARDDGNGTIQPSDRIERSQHNIRYLIKESDKWVRGR
jgi:hypothetical protein